ncbi:MAG: hypothetical protein NTX50_02730 [Candidatus Sumerlaeota bacterium]|nr:hypothetical protein [Candidatus Sumerlaeota bacterium]
MTCRFGRREFVKGSLAAGAGVAAALSLEERVLLAQTGAAAKPGAGKGAVGGSDRSDASDGSDKSDVTKAAGGAAPSGQAFKVGSKGTMPMGKIKGDSISRIILGGNLIGGFAHSRDLRYVSKLVQEYHTPEKIFETFQLAEEYGINCVNTNPKGRDVMIRYWRERGGKIKWQLHVYIESEKQLDDIARYVDDGAWAIQVQGNITDRLAREGKAEVVAKIVETIRERGALAGYAAHEVETLEACEKAGVKPDYVIKTLHTRNYWSARPEDTDKWVIDNTKADNCWCRYPEKTIEHMKAVEVPWIAFKVLAAGAIPPRDGLQYAFNNGADFCLLGMFDFQIAQDAKIANEVLANVKRSDRPWKA